MSQNKILFICMGNICRSPTAEALFTHLLNESGLQDMFEVDSAGTHAYHIGNPPDKRSMAAALNRGVEMRHLRARQVEAADFERFDRLIVMDRANLAEIKSRFPNKAHDKLSLMMSYAQLRSETEVPDPYYGGDDGFEVVLDLLTEAAQGLLSEFDLKRHYG
ncbi:MAG: low molecular weight phosphotyrosine protein phosphatase [Proteobacteria bacterium]|nr:MAG: low molecular weight phosphotyrosine protein phosphatase [Pseudomonadota bacterium]